MIKLGATDIVTAKLGSTQVSKIYLGSTEVWSAMPSRNNALISPTGLTGYTSGAITVSASSEYNTGYRAWKAFDGLTAVAATQAWLSAQFGGPQWLKVDFGANATAYSIQINNRNANSWEVKDFVIESSDDDATWTTRLTVIGASPSNVSQAWDLTTPATARYWRLRGTANTLGGLNFGILEWRIYS